MARSAAPERPIISWDASRDEVLSGLRAAPSLTYLAGIEIEVLEAEPASGSSKQVAAGRLAAFDSDGGMVIGTKNGSILVSAYRARFAGHEVDDLRPVLAVFEIPLPAQLGPRPFLSNRDVAVAEIGIRAWEELTPASEPPVAPDPEAEPVDGRRAAIEANRAYFTDLIARLAVPSGGRALDIGCGDGWACTALADAGLRVAGIDVVPYALATARYHEKRADFHELDYFDAGAQFSGESFDLIFCRELSPAIKLVDWNDKEWIAATSAVAATLAPAGAMVWIQLTDRSERVDVNGFTNPSLETLKASFEACGLRVATVACWSELTCLTLVRADAADEVAERIAAFDRAASGAACARLASAKGAPDADHPAVEPAYRAALVEFGTLQPLGAGAIGIAGEGLLAQIFEQAAFDAFGAGVQCFRLGGDAPETVAAVVVADEDGRAAAEKAGDVAVLDPLASGGGRAKGAPWVISGDQDTNLFAVRKPLLAVSLNAGRLPAAVAPRTFEPDAMLEGEAGWSFQGDGLLRASELGVATVALGDVSALLQWRPGREKSPAGGGPLLAEVIGARLSGADDQAVMVFDNGGARATVHIGPDRVWIGNDDSDSLAVATRQPQVYLVRVAPDGCSVEVGGKRLEGAVEAGRRVGLQLGLSKGYTADSECHWGRVAVGFEQSKGAAAAKPNAKRPQQASRKPRSN